MAGETDGDKDGGKGAAGGATAHPGMMGDGTEEQNLGQPGNPGARITEDEVEEAFGGTEGEASGSAGAPR